MVRGVQFSNVWTWGTSTSMGHRSPRPQVLTFSMGARAPCYRSAAPGPLPSWLEQPSKHQNHDIEDRQRQLTSYFSGLSVVPAPSMADRRAFLAEGEDHESWILQALKDSNQRAKSGVSVQESEEKGYEEGPRPVTPETLALAYLQLLHKAKQTSGTGQPDNLAQRQQSDGHHHVHLMSTQGGAYFTAIQKPGGAMPHETLSPQRLLQQASQQQPLFPAQEDHAAQHLAKFSYLALLQGDLTDLLSIRAAELVNNRRRVKVSKWRKLLLEARKMLVRRRAVAAVMRSRRDSFEEAARPGTVAMMRGLGCCIMVALLALLLCLDRHRHVPAVVRELGSWGESGKAGLGAVWGGVESSKAMEMKLASTATRPSTSELKVPTALQMHAEDMRSLEEAFLSAASEAAASSPPEPVVSALAPSGLEPAEPVASEPAISSEAPAEVEAAAEEPTLAEDACEDSPSAHIVPSEVAVLQAVNTPVPSLPAPSTPTLPTPSTDSSASPSVSLATPASSTPPPVGEAAGEEPDPLSQAKVVEAGPSGPRVLPSSLDAPVEARPHKREDRVVEDASLSAPPRQTARQLAQGAALRLSALPRLLRKWCFYPAVHLQAINARLSFSSLPWRRRRASEEAIAAVLSGSQQLVTVASARQLQLSRGMATEKLEKLYQRAFIEEEMTLLEALAICGMDQVMRGMELRWLRTQEWLTALLEDWEDEEMHLQRRRRIQSDAWGPRCPGAASAKEHVACWLRGLLEVLARQGKRMVIRTKMLEYLSKPTFPLLYKSSSI